ncbi:hypothetical protein [Pedobacter steynii]|uniref:Uncharacterized protein n=1 Tax=Pedobacter steynii TaxID=430522 RepID=A0A1D7QN49_9SPHI|nr:hypothetical protein [Pedobacter steynii]AOM80084.1 hypothetical protein BFS30_24735 [Pedobacter steynii]
MAELKKRILSLSTGRQIKLYGNSLAIGKSLEVGEGYAPNVLSFYPDAPADKVSMTVNNPYKFTAEEIQEIADYNIRLWMELKDNLRKHGIASNKIFNKDGVL